MLLKFESDRFMKMLITAEDNANIKYQRSKQEAKS